MMPSVNQFLSIEEFTRYCDNTVVNCATASVLRKGNVQNVKAIARAFLNLDASLEVGESFLRRVDENRALLGFDSSNFRRISTPDEAPEAHIIYQMWGFEDVEVPYTLFGCTFTSSKKDFHVMVGVRDKLSGELRWFHKFGRTNEDPREVSTADWEEIWSSYKSSPVYLAFEG